MSGTYRTRNRRTAVVAATAMYAAAVAVTVLFFIFRNYDNPLRLAVSLPAALFAESGLFSYRLFWLRKHRGGRSAQPLLFSGAVIVASYAVVALASVVVLDLLLELSTLWYALEQLLVLAVTLIALGAAGLYGYAGQQEAEVADSTRIHRQHRTDLAAISGLVRSWKHPQQDRLEAMIAKLEEEFAYSDPVSAAGLMATEEMLSGQISLLHDHVTLLLALPELPGEWEAETIEISDRMIATLERRNRELAELK